MSDSSKLVLVVIASAFAGAVLGSLTPYILPVAIGTVVVAGIMVYVGKQHSDNRRSEY